MSTRTRMIGLFASLFFLISTSVAAPPPGKGGGPGGFQTISKKNWGETPVRNILAAFAYGGLASDSQIETWASMSPGAAIAEMLTFSATNPLLSNPDGDDDSELYCHSLAQMQAFWSGNSDGNIMKYADRYRYATLSGNGSLSTSNLQRTWTKVISTRGCNQFLHKMGLFLTNYHASISAHKTRAGLIRSYYDDIVQELIDSGNFVEVMTTAATHAAVARAYGHQYSRYYNNSETFSGTDDFAREFHQLFFRILGTTEDEGYHEDTTIEHTAWMLSGMNLDKVEEAYGSTRAYEWWVSPIQFSDHYDENSTPRWLKNSTYHYHSDAESESGTCLEILHQGVCGRSADEKIADLTPIAAAHPESMQNVPVFMIDFFADDNLDQGKMDQIRSAWEEAEYNILSFIQAYAISTAFHHSSTYKYFTAFDRNLILQNAQILSNEENFARNHGDSPVYRMAEQGAEVFEPAHDVFGGQTGYQAANNRYIFKDAFWANVENPTFFDDFNDDYTLEAGTETEPAPVYRWEKDWASIIPVNGDGSHVAGEVADWLWNRFIGDGGENFDPIARAQVQSILATYRDLGYVMDPDNPDEVYSSSDITKKKGIARQVDEENAAFVMDNLSPLYFNKRVGLAINFISMLPYSFAMEGK